MLGNTQNLTSILELHQAIKNLINDLALDEGLGGGLKRIKYNTPLLIIQLLIIQWRVFILSNTRGNLENFTKGSQLIFLIKQPVKRFVDN